MGFGSKKDSSFIWIMATLFVELPNENGEFHIAIGSFHD